MLEDSLELDAPALALASQTSIQQRDEHGSKLPTLGTLPVAIRSPPDEKAPIFEHAGSRFILTTRALRSSVFLGRKRAGGDHLHVVVVVDLFLGDVVFDLEVDVVVAGFVDVDEAAEDTARDALRILLEA